MRRVQEWLFYLCLGLFVLFLGADITVLLAPAGKTMSTSQAWALVLPPSPLGIATTAFGLLTIGVVLWGALKPDKDSPTGQVVGHVHAEGGSTAIGTVHGPVTIGVQKPISEAASNHQAVIRKLRELVAEGNVLVARGRSPVYRTSCEQEVTQWKNRVLDVLQEIDEGLVQSFMWTSHTRPVNLRPMPPHTTSHSIPARSVAVHYKPTPDRPYPIVGELAIDMPTAVATLEAMIEQLNAKGPQS
jgi:hypothetical protein